MRRRRPRRSDADAKIQSAMSAALPVIAESATIIDWPSEPGGEPALLREGSNDWLCLPDNIGTPGNDPMCVDPTWQIWMNAYMAGAEPEITAPGISYMLAGGSDPSNFDPYATGPEEGEDWVNSGPHIMLLMPGGFDPADFSTDHLSGGPYIMWEGTPYEHLMVPVVPAAEAIGPIATTDSDEVKIENIMGAASADDRRWRNLHGLAGRGRRRHDAAARRHERVGLRTRLAGHAGQRSHVLRSDLHGLDGRFHGRR